MSRAKGRLQAIRRKIRANRHGEAAIQGVNSENNRRAENRSDITIVQQTKNRKNNQQIKIK